MATQTLGVNLGILVLNMSAQGRPSCMMAAYLGIFLEYIPHEFIDSTGSYEYALHQDPFSCLSALQ